MSSHLISDKIKLLGFIGILIFPSALLFSQQSFSDRLYVRWCIFDALRIFSNNLAAEYQNLHGNTVDEFTGDWSLGYILIIERQINNLTDIDVYYIPSQKNDFQYLKEKNLTIRFRPVNWDEPTPSIAEVAPYTTIRIRNEKQFDLGTYNASDQVTYRLLGAYLYMYKVSDPNDSTQITNDAKAILNSIAGQLIGLGGFGGPVTASLGFLSGKVTSAVVDAFEDNGKSGDFVMELSPRIASIPIVPGVPPPLTPEEPASTTGYLFLSDTRTIEIDNYWEGILYFSRPPGNVFPGLPTVVLSMDANVRTWLRVSRITNPQFGLHYGMNQESFALEWDGIGTLESSVSLNNWQEIQQAESTYLLEDIDEEVFYRIIRPDPFAERLIDALSVRSGGSGEDFFAGTTITGKPESVTFQVFSKSLIAENNNDHFWVGGYVPANTDSGKYPYTVTAVYNDDEVIEDSGMFSVFSAKMFPLPSSTVGYLPCDYDYAPELISGFTAYPVGVSTVDGFVHNCFELQSPSSKISFLDSTEELVSAFDLWLNIRQMPSHIEEEAIILGTNDNSMSLSVSSAGNVVYSHNWTGEQPEVIVVSEGTLEPGVWTHLAFESTQDGKLRIYIDGALNGEMIAPIYSEEDQWILSPFREMIIGDPFGERSVHAYIDDAAFYREPLNEEIVNAIYLSGKSGKLIANPIISE